MIILDNENIEDEAARENFEKISEEMNSNAMVTAEFKSFQIEATNTTSVIKVRHGLKFTPTDVFVSWVSPISTVAIRYDLIDEEFIAVTTSAACTIRLIAGRMN